MSAASIPLSIREFIARCFGSVDALEVTMLLRRSPGTFWSPAAVAEQLGIREDIAARHMSALAAQDILITAPESAAYRYAPNDEEVAVRITELAALYSERRISVINAIYSANLERLRTFSRAFKLK